MKVFNFNYSRVLIDDDFSIQLNYHDITSNCKMTGISRLVNIITQLEKNYKSEDKVKEALRLLLPCYPSIFVTVIGKHNTVILKKYFDSYYEIEVPTGYDIKVPQVHLLLKNKYNNNQYLRDTPAVINNPVPSGRRSCL